jgi:hypothetical protein
MKPLELSDDVRAGIVRTGGYDVGQYLANGQIGAVIAT